MVGAGLAGLAFAAAAGRHGHDVQVRDERPALGGGAALTLWPNALAALDRLDRDLAQAVRERAEPVAALTVRRADGGLIRRLDPTAVVRRLGEPLRVVDRGTLQGLLAEAVGVEQITLGAPVVDPTTDLATQPGDRVAGEHLVVGADGFRSVIARHLDPRMRESPAGYVAWRGIADHTLDPALAGVVWRGDAEAGAMPLPGGRTYWFITAAGATPESGPEPDPDSGGWPAPFAELIAATGPEARWFHPMTDRTVPRHWHDTAHVVIGDAAHAMQPGLGQGGCTALEDAVSLADSLGAVASAPRGPDRAAALTAALNAWERRRRRRVLPILRAARIAGATLHRPARTAALSPLARRTPEVVALTALARVASRAAGERSL